MRTVRIIIILLVLIGFPAISWFYLSSGLKWRINAQQETMIKEHLGNFTLVDSDSIILRSNEMHGTFYVIATPQDSQSFQHLKMVNTQFHVRKDFRTMYLLPEGEDASPQADTTWIHVYCIQGCEALRTVLFNPDYSGAIVDDSLYLRGQYHLGSGEEMRKLVEHLAVVLPIEKRERIELIRGKQ